MREVLPQTSSNKFLHVSNYQYTLTHTNKANVPKTEWISTTKGLILFVKTNKLWNMDLERYLQEALDNLAHTSGFRTGQYTITLEREHEFLYKGAEKRVTISPKNDRENTLHLKIKQRPSTQSELTIPWECCFFNNVHYYTTVLPILRTYGNVPMSPKYYGSSLKLGEEYLILEDLERTEHYKRLEPFPGLSRPYLKEAIKMLAYFHCTVQLWKKANPKQFKSICGQFRPFLGAKFPAKEEAHKFEKIMNEWVTGIGLMMRKENDYRKTFHTVLANSTTLIEKAIMYGAEVEDQPWTTLVNCFTYTTNLLFKCHTVTGAVIDVGLEDWSAVRLGSPALDLSLLLFACTSADILAESTTLVNEYFTDHLSVTELKERHIPRFGIFGVFGGIFINIAKSIENKIELKMELVTSQLLSDANFTSSNMPDLKARLVAIVKAAVANKIFDSNRENEILK